LSLSSDFEWKQTYIGVVEVLVDKNN
jgi:hypothetical protein